MFKFVKIPADAEKPLEILEESKKGGLTKDCLVQHAKEYFHQLTGNQGRVDHIDNAGPEDRQALANQIRQQLQNSPGMAERLDAMDDDAVLDVIYKAQSQPSCEIMALTIPCSGNDYQAVSMYSAEGAKQYDLALNRRATAILTACGHTGEVYGDSFCGRASDNEATDNWERLDFTEEDADPHAPWIRKARSQGGGGGTGSSAASSLSGLLQQQQQSNAMAGRPGVQVLNTGGGSEATPLYGSDGAPPVQESWGTWTQTDTEVELKFSVASGTKSKYCKINFGRTNLKIAVTGQTLLHGTLFDPVHADECTFTIEDAGSGRELCVTLYKIEPRTWTHIVTTR